VACAIACGLGGAVAAVLFRLMIRTVQALAFEGAPGIDGLIEEGLLAEAGDPLEAARGLAWYWRLTIPAIGGLIVGPLVWFYAREAQGHGVPEVMKAVALRGGVIRPRIVAIKALASALSIGTGGSVGREGPIVQIGSAFGSMLGQLLGVKARELRTIVGCGAAAGISATFNAPIAGALFAAEVIVGDFAVAQFSPIVISSVVATVVSRFALGNHPAFPVPSYEIVSPFEIFPYMVAGLIAGLVGVLFIRSVTLAEETFEAIRIPGYLKASLGGLCVGAIGVALPQVFGVGYTTISEALEGNLTATLLGALLVAKIVATSVTIGSGGSGGIFAPSLFLGAMTGGFLGTFIHSWFPEATATSGAYALVTMGAVVAATTQAPISAILIIFELTQTIDIIPALMAACVISTLVSQLLSRDSIYTAKLRRQGVDIFQHEEANPLKSLFVRDVIDREPEHIPANARFDQLLDLVVQSRHTQFFVEDAEGRLLGAIALDEMRRLIYESDALRHLVVASDLIEPGHPVVRLDDDLDLVSRLFTAANVEEIAVVDRDDPTRLVGTVQDNDVAAAHGRELVRRDLAGGLSTSFQAVSQGGRIDLGDGFALQQITTPPSSFGRTLRDLDLRARIGVQVLLVRSASGQRVRVPRADDVVGEGDTLVVAGETQALDKLERLAAAPRDRK
jgi:CIC family chloride channel protein